MYNTHLEGCQAKNLPELPDVAESEFLERQKTVVWR